jgi:uncharacterized protein YgiM (DUF1202 family)
MDSIRFTRRAFTRIAAGGAIAGAAIPAGLRGRDVVAQVGDTQLTCNANNVNVRLDPGLGATVVGRLFVGDIVYLIGNPVKVDGYAWLNITGASRQVGPGWVASSFFDAPSGGGLRIGSDVYVDTDVLNMRDYPGLTGTVINTLSQGAHALTSRAAVRRDGYTWYGVVLESGPEGYLAGEYLTVTPLNDATDGWPIGTSVRVSSDGLRLRRGPGTEYEVIRTYSRGDDGEVLDSPVMADGFRWYEVRMYSDGTSGWMADTFLEIARYEPTGTRLRVVDGPLNLREGSGLSNDVITTIPEGDVVVIADASIGVADGYNWWYVRLEDQPSVVGWIADGFTEQID